MSALAEEVAAALGAPVTRLTAVAGGDINEAYAAELGDGRRAFVKAHPDAPPGTFEAEAAGLGWLAVPAGPPVPRVLGRGERSLVLEWIEPGTLDAQGEAAFGRELAALHAAGAPAFGATPPGTPPATGYDAPPLRIGPLLLPNDPAPTWADFYAERRLRPLAEMAQSRDVLPYGAGAAVQRVCERIEQLAGPEEPPARLHGDLWAGNVLGGADGRAWLIDPAAHGGHRETDLAMLRLFGGPSARCFAAYEEAAPLPDGHADRVELWQLMPLLVHAVLFGGGYGAAVARAAARYG